MSLRAQLEGYWNPTEEVCGIITDKGVAIVVPNMAQDKTNSFILDKREFLTVKNALEKNQRHIQGIFHTHPSGDPTPSKKDLEVFRKLPYDMIIVGSEGKTTWLRKE